MTGEQVSAMDITKLSLTWSCQKVYAHAVIYKLIAGVLRQAKPLLSDNLPPIPRRAALSRNDDRQRELWPGPAHV